VRNARDISRRSSTARRALKWAAAVVGVGITLALGSTAFVTWTLDGTALLATPRFSSRQFLDVLEGHMGWVIAFLLLSALILPLRAVQWQRTLEQQVPFTERWHLVNIGGLVHNCLPGNLGDLTRAFLLARTQRMPFVAALGSVAVCKLLELVALLMLAALVMPLPFWDRLPEVVTAMRWGSAASLALVVLTIALARGSGPLGGRLERRGRFVRIARGLRQVDAGLGAVRSAGGMARAFLASVPPSAVGAVAYGIGLAAIGVPHGALAGPLMLAMIAIGKGIPGVPTGPGVYVLVASWAARSLGASGEAAAAYALATNVATGISQWVPGLVSLAVRRIRWSELKRDSAAAADEANRRAGAPQQSGTRRGRLIRFDTPAPSDER
jgi:hypothetical protein